MNWNAIGYVTSGVTLAAFIAATAAWLINQGLARTQKIIQTAPEADRQRALVAVLERFNVDTAGLSEAAKLKLALEQLYERRRRLMLLVVAIVFLACVGLGFTAYAMGRTSNTQVSMASPGALIAARAVVPPVAPKKSDQEMPESDSTTFRTVRDVSVWDLRAWRKLSVDERISGRNSPVNYINYLHVKRTGAANITYVAHYSTEGYAIDLRCLTQKHEVFSLERGSSNSEVKLKRYELRIDLSDLKVGEDALVVVEGTYWNSFQNDTEWASTYTDNDGGDLSELVTFILLPDGRPFKSVEYLMGPEGANSDALKPMQDPERIYVDTNKQSLFWTILKPKPNHHYEVKWTW